MLAACTAEPIRTSGGIVSTAAPPVGAPIDANGNLTADGVRSYTWNERNQLASLSGPVNGSFAYDGVGRRRAKTIGSTTTQFLYDGLNAVQELAGGTPTANLLTGLGIDEFFSRTDSAGVREFLTDALGSTVALADGSGSVQTEYTYEPFGNVTTSGAATSNSYAFTEREADGTGLYYYRARYHHPGAQRFISEDPIGYTAGDVNLHAYVHNSPPNFTDPEGLCVPLGPVAVSCIPAAAAAAAQAAAYAAATMAAWEVGQALSERMSEYYAQRGKRNVRDSEFENLTDAEVAERARDRSRSAEERRRYQREEKARGTRNRQRRGGEGEGGEGGAGGGGGGRGRGGRGGGGAGGGAAGMAGTDPSLPPCLSMSGRKC